MDVEYEVRNNAAIVSLNRDAKLNAFTHPMIAAIRAAVEKAEKDPAVVGIVVTGIGRAFSSGLDIGTLGATVTDASDGPHDAPPPTGELPALFSFLLKISKPVIAAVNGVAAGGGFVLAMMCDLRFVSEKATFTTVFSKRGLIAEHATSWILPRMIGTSRALDLLWSSVRIDAQEAYRIGFADRLFAPDALLDETITYIDRLAENVSRRSLATIKSEVYRHLSMPLAEAVWDADAVMQKALAHADAQEGVASFVERRPPRFARWTGDTDG